MHQVVRSFTFVCLFLSAPALARGADTLKLNSPQPHQVIQRFGTAAGVGYANVLIRGELPRNAASAEWQYHVTTLVSEPQEDHTWIPLRISQEGTAFQATARVAAGGWYRLSVRCRHDDEVLAAGTVEPIGVGELFLVAGQSYATNCNDKRFDVTDPLARVVAYDSAKASWRVAHDPQPAPDGSDGGSIWPPLGDALAKELKVPIGFANVAVGATSSIQWMPDGDLHPRLVATGKQLGRFRAVLWQQGESDVIAKTPTAAYIENLSTIRDSATTAWGFEARWLLAKSTLHPTVYDDAEGESRIRTAIDALWKRPGFARGPDTDTLRDENRGDRSSRRHFSAVGQQRAAELWRTAICQTVVVEPARADAIQVGLAEADITPPVGFPMAGYYHERLAVGMIDPLKAKAIVFRGKDSSAALVVCDLIGIATDLSHAVRQQAAEQTGIPATNIVIAGTHTHTAPDYIKELWLKLGDEPQEPLRAKYIESLIGTLVSVIGDAYRDAKPSLLEIGAATQQTPVAFNRRFVMRDGSVKTWQSFSNPNVIRAAGPIDSEIGVVSILDESGSRRGVFSNFALHLDTVGGQKWSADYPFFIARKLQSAEGGDLISIFGTGCCGDINHVDPSNPQRNSAAFIGNSLGDSIVAQLNRLSLVEQPRLVVKSRVVKLPLEDATKEEVTRAVQVLELAQRGEKVDFFDHVTAHKKLMLDQFRHRTTYAKTSDHITWGLSRALKGIGAELPVDVTVMTIGADVAFVCLPGEVFVDLGLAIKQGSPFRTTMIVELSNVVETIYVPHRAAYAGGSYEVTNSALQPGAGEMLVETALSLLREAATTE